MKEAGKPAMAEAPPPGVSCFERDGHEELAR